MYNVNWEITLRPQLMGGISIGNSSHHNLALLAKWIFRFLCEHDALWRKFIVAKCYTIDCMWPTISRHGSLKSPWRSICQTIDLVANRAQCCLGNGSSISF